jgi:mannose-6-phosphate isomerase-like protein (cupin superfamily)
MKTQAFGLFRAGEVEAQLPAGERYLEFMRVASMSAGLYVLPAGSEDRQLPHQQDELYVVLEGRARFRAGTEERTLTGGEILFVAARMEHRFHHIEQTLKLLVVFAPPESG